MSANITVANRRLGCRRAGRFSLSTAVPDIVTARSAPLSDLYQCSKSVALDFLPVEREAIINQLWIARGNQPSAWRMSIRLWRALEKLLASCGRRTGSFIDLS